MKTIYHFIWTVIILVLFSVIAFNVYPRDYSTAVIHHTASHDVSAETINNWHTARGFAGIGYHFVIRANGDIEQGRPYHKNGAHARGRNDKTGIALTGNNGFTKEQLTSLDSLLIELGVERVERHHEQCPGDSLDVEGLTNAEGD